MLDQRAQLLRAAVRLRWHRSTTMAAGTALILTGCATGGVLDASWVAPVTNTDGTPVTEVVSYRVYYSTTDPPCPRGRAIVAAAPKVPLPPDQRLEVRLTGLTLGKLYYVAVAEGGATSGGNQASITIRISYGIPSYCKTPVLPRQGSHPVLAEKQPQPASIRRLLGSRAW